MAENFFNLFFIAFGILVIAGTGMATFLAFYFAKDFLKKHQKSKGLVVDIDTKEYSDSGKYYTHIIEYSPNGSPIWAKNNYSVATKEPSIGDQVDILYHSCDYHLVSMKLKQRKTALIFVIVFLFPLLILAYANLMLLLIHLMGSVLFFVFFKRSAVKKSKLRKQALLSRQIENKATR